MRVVNGTTYHQDTPDDLIEVLERVRSSGMRCAFHYGDVETGRPWGDAAVGRLGRSQGRPVGLSRKIPIVLYNSRSICGEGLLDHCIIKITKTRGGAQVYRLNKEKQT